MMRSTLALLLMGIASELSCTVVQADTPTPAAPSAQVGFFRGDLGHTGVSAEKIAAPLSLLWRHTTLAAANNSASAVYAGGTVYLISGGVISALNASDGTTRWQYPADGKPVAVFGATPALADGFLYLTDDSGQLHKLDALTGKEVWKSKLDGALRSAPVVNDGAVYFGSSNSHCYAVSAATGQTLWDVTTGGPVTTSPTVTGGLVVFTSSDNSVYSLNARTGRKSWSVPFDADPSIVPVVYDGRTLYITAGDTIYSLDPGSGRQRTTIKLPTMVLIPPTISADSLYIISQSNTLYALSADGRERWKLPLQAAPSAPPLLAGTLLLVATQPGVLSGYDTAGGRLVWRYVMPSSATDSQPKQANANVFAAPIAADGALYVVSDDGSLSAFRHDAVDDIGPEVLQLTPAAGATIPVGNVTYGALITDLGSGIDPASISLELDGTLDSAALFHADANAIYNTSTTPLTEGDHQITVKASDWRGNVTAQNWHFTVQNGAVNPGRFNPFGRSDPGAGGRNPSVPPPPPPL